MNYSFKEKITISKNINTFLKKQGFDISGKGKKQNKIMVDFLKEFNLPYVKWNNKYKGLNTADLINSITINHNWIDFESWILNKKYCNND